MKTKKLFLKHLACWAAVLVLNSSLSAQIVYTDIPDATPNATYPLDLNNDLVDDFLIQFDVANKVMCIPQNNNAYAGTIVNGVHLPWALPASAAICNTLTTWYNAAHPGTMAFGTNTGYWVGETDKYLALQLIIGANTYYGWVRLDVTGTSASFTVKDYAYQSTPNTCIQAGQVSLSLTEHTRENSFSIYPNPFTSSATIQITGNSENTELSIFNAYGQIVKHLYPMQGDTFTLSRDDLPCGLYFIQLTKAHHTIAVKKVTIADK